MVIVSPYAKPGFTDSTVATFASMLAFTEHTFVLPSLGAADANAYDYTDSFDFKHSPRSAPTPILAPQPVSPAALAQIASHLPDPDDPT